MSIKPSPNIFQYVKSDRDLINLFDTAGVYRIEYTDEMVKKVIIYESPSEKLMKV